MDQDQNKEQRGMDDSQLSLDLRERSLRLRVSAWIGGQAVGDLVKSELSALGRLRLLCGLHQLVEWLVQLIAAQVDVSDDAVVVDHISRRPREHVPG